VAFKPQFETVMDLYSSEIFAYLWRQLNGREDAEDCLQEVFIRAFKAFGRLEEDSHIRAWLYKIATNVAISYRKKWDRSFGQNVEFDNNIMSADPSPQKRLEVMEHFEVLMGAINSLPNQQRSALLMRKYQELSYAEISRILDCSEEAARANVYQALKKLRARFLDDRDKRSE
jgi:RNA polymerase sigma-70 factor (ECF subfamily)